MFDNIPLNSEQIGNRCLLQGLFLIGFFSLVTLSGCAADFGDKDFGENDESGRDAYWSDSPGENADTNTGADECPEDDPEIIPGICGCGVVEENCGPWGYEAEDSTAVQNVKLSTTSPGYSGTGYMDFGDLGSWLEWDNVAIPVAGDYKLEFRYSTAHYHRPSMLVINGVEYGQIPFNGIAEAAWSDWNVNVVTAPLPTGNSTIRVRALQQGGPNLDRLTVTWAG